MHRPFITCTRGNQTIVLLGMIHVGTEEYYRTVKNILDYYESLNFTVLYEDIDGVDNALHHIIGAPFQGVIEAKQAAFALLKNHGLHYQIDAIPIQPHWVCGDDVSAIIKAMECDANEDWSNIIMERQLRYEAILRNPGHWYHLIDHLIKHPTQQSGYHGLRPFETIAFRNQALVEKIGTYSPDTSIITCWGTAHLPGIVAELKKKDFTVQTAVFS